jgi:protein dithiol oxidoreductase (disulfide-forming)
MPYRLLGLLLLSFAIVGHAQSPIVAGKDYVLIDPPQPTTSGERIEVLEAFAYTCGACAQIQLLVNNWKQRLPDDVAFDYVPVVWGGVAEHFARAYFAADSLGLQQQTHDAAFNALHIERRQFRSEDDIAAFFAEQGGVSKDDFLATMKSFAVNTRVNRTRQQLQRYGVDATPTFIVAGKYRVRGGDITFERMLQIVDQLIELERRAKAG